jgi:hypothetical protein
MDSGNMEKIMRSSLFSISSSLFSFFFLKKPECVIFGASGA